MMTMRAVFQTALVETSLGFQDRARGLQDISAKAALGHLYADMVLAAPSGI